MRLPALLVLAAAACATPHTTEPGVEPRPVVETQAFGANGTVLDVPTVVRAGATFTIRYAVFGSSSCLKHRVPETSVGTDFFLILPRLQPVGPNTPCTDDLATVTNTITASWPTPIAELRVIVRGYRFDGTGVDVIRRIRVE
ncbi:MAG: hypothetical protein IPK85_10510 [Gemmatimonadetes bacterium]|nr:hypothetical protein [Gemmatimonadota bacterium]